MQTTSSLPKTGETAPNSTILDAQGNEIELRDQWESAQKALALIFVRHFGCQFCREHVATIKQKVSEFDTQDIDILVIGNGTPARAAAFATDMKTPFPVMTDPSGKTQQAYGLGAAPATAILKPQELLGGARALFKGFIPHRPQGDSQQLAGQFLIAPTGTILLAERATMISEIVDPDHLLEAAQTINHAPA